MDFKYTVTIKGSKDTIEFKPEETHSGNESITGVQFGYRCKVDSFDRDKNGRTEIKIFGKLDDRPETFNAIKSLAEWSKEKDNVYREVTIVATSKNQDSEGTGNFRRTYHFDKMFCVNYVEKSGIFAKDENNEGSASLTFEVYLAQAPNYHISETMSEIVNE